MTSIEALSPAFGVDPQDDRFCTTLQGQHNLMQLGARLAGSRSLVGLYVTESAEPDYQPDPAQRGRVVALVRMLPMPQGHTVQSYPSGCMRLRDNHSGSLADWMAIRDCTFLAARRSCVARRGCVRA